MAIFNRRFDKKPLAFPDFDKATASAGDTHGNVITGQDPDSGSNKLLLLPDAQGDGPAFIRSITHDGATYTLSADKTAVTVSGTPSGAWSYDDTTGDLTITTDLGGTLKINLDGATPGKYTYTPPASIGSGWWQSLPPFLRDLFNFKTETFAYKIEDTDGDTSTSLLTVTVKEGTSAPANQAPSGADATVATNEDTPYVFTTGDFGFSDPDGNALQALKITTLPAAGTLILNTAPVAAGDVILASDIEAGLLVFVPAENANGAGYASLAFQVQDDGGTDNGGVDLDQSPNTITIDVNAVNDAPAGADQTVVTSELAPLALMDFGFSDPDDAAFGANDFEAVKVTTLPTSGTLTVGGIPVSAGDFVSADDIAAGLLMFTPDQSGTDASFTFQVQDDGGIDDGGVDLDPVARTFTIEVNLPVLSTIEEDIAEEGNAGTLVAGFPGVGAGEGIAIIGLNDTNGDWQFYSFIDEEWVDIDPNDLDGETGLLLGPDDLLRFIPSEDYSGTSGPIEYRSWDLSVGDPGQLEPIPSDGSEPAFSAASFAAIFDVTPVADPARLSAVILPSLGSETTVNVQAESDQLAQQVTQLADGRLLFTWTSPDPDVDGNSEGISARIGTPESDGSVTWATAGEFTVNDTSAGIQASPQVTELADGRVAFTWLSQDVNVAGTIFDLSFRIGTVESDGSITWATAGEVTYDPSAVVGTGVRPQISELADGRLLVTWNSDPTANDDLTALIGTVEADGDITWASAGELTVNEQTAGVQARPQVMVLPDGRVLFTWDGGDISGRIGTVESDGSITWASAGEFTVNVETEGSQISPQVTMLADGRVLFAWQSSDPDVDGDGTGISARIGTVESDGSITWASTGEFTVNDLGAGAQSFPQVELLDDGRVLFTWQTSDSAMDGSSAAVAGRIGTVQADGSILWEGTEFAVNDQAESLQGVPSVTALDDGRAAITWLSQDPGVDGDGSGIAARIVDPEAHLEDSPIAVDITAALTDVDGSETLGAVTASGLPDGFMISDGVNSATSTGESDVLDLTGWALADVQLMPAADYNGSFTLAVTQEVTDTAELSAGPATDATTVTRTAYLTVTPVNDAPVVDQGIADQLGTEDAPLSFIVPENAFSDVDGDALSLDALLADGGDLPDWLSFDGTEFTATPAAGDAGSYDVTVTATDPGGLMAETSFTLTVDPAMNDLLLS